MRRAPAFPLIATLSLAFASLYASAPETAQAAAGVPAAAEPQGRSRQDVLWDYDVARPASTTRQAAAPGGRVAGGEPDPGHDLLWGYVVARPTPASPSPAAAGFHGARSRTRAEVLWELDTARPTAEVLMRGPSMPTVAATD